MPVLQVSLSSIAKSQETLIMSSSSRLQNDGRRRILAVDGIDL